MTPTVQGNSQAMQEFRSIKAHLLYWIIPAAIIFVWIALYFSGDGSLQRLSVPPWPENREFGGLENTQNVILIIILGMVIWGAVRASTATERALMIFFTLGSLFIFLEEIDYGLHYIDHIRGVEPHEAREVRNLHNQGDLTDRFKNLSDTILVLFFVVLPWLVKERSHPLLRYFTPSRMCTIAAVVMVLQSRFAHSLQDAGLGQIDGTEGQLSTNISEFRETFVYWIWMLYFHALVFLREWPKAGKTQAPEQGA